MRQEDADILLKDRNVLQDPVVEKYRLAGQVAQTCLQYLTSLINDSYHLGKRDPISASELCILGDSYIASSLKDVYKKGSTAVRERGISQPVTIELNDIVAGFAPELGDESNCFFKPGDIVTISLGCHIDGYTANLSHTLVIYPPGEGPELKPTGPLLGSKADAICASHIATEAVVALLGASLTPEKLPQQLNISNNTVTGSQIRSLVDSIADSYNCVVVPGSKVRRVRRFLAGQSEGVVAERDFKGVVWSESDQELKLLEKSRSINSSTDLITVDKKLKSVSNSSAIPTDEFIVTPGEVYNVEIRMAPLSDINEPGLITLQTIDNYTGKNNDESAFHCKPSIYVRDYAIQYSLKLRASKLLVNKIDKELSVYPFKLAHTSQSFPVSAESSKSSEEQLLNILADIKQARLGLSELSNRRMCVARPIQIARFVPLPSVLSVANPTGPIGYDSEKPTLPGLEIPLPRLGLTSLKLKSLLKKSKFVPVAKESTTILLLPNSNEVLRLTGGSKISKPSWVHSAFELNGEMKESVLQLLSLSQDKRFGIKVREVQPFKYTINSRQTVENMIID